MASYNTSTIGTSFDGGRINLRDIISQASSQELIERDGVLSLHELRALATKHTGEPYWLAGDIDVRDIATDAYQRPIEETRLSRMIRDVNTNGWNPLKAGEMSINVRRDGTVYVMDGQHRVMCILAVKGRAPYVQRVVVYIGLSRQQEAEYFSSTQDASARRPVLPADIHNARLYMDEQSHEHQRAWVVEDIVQKYGFYIAQSTRSEDSVRLAAVQAVLKIEDRYGADILDATLDLITSIWGNRPAPESKVIEGIAKFIAMFPDANYNSLIKRLKNWAAKTFVNEAFYRGEAAGYKSRVDQIAYFTHREYDSIGRRLAKLPRFDDSLDEHNRQIRSDARKKVLEATK